MNGDGTLDVVVRSESGVLEIWQITALGASRYEVAMQAPPTQAFDVDRDDLIDLAGEVARDPEDPIAPRLTDVATFNGGLYTNTAPAARAFHAQLAAPRSPAPPAPAAAASARPPTPLPSPRDEVRLRGAIERAWHAVLSGKSRKETLNELSREPVPPALRAAFERHRRRIAALPEVRSAKEGRAGAPD